MDSERWVLFTYHDLIPDWQAHAACAGAGYDTYFGNEDEQPTMSIKQVRTAARLCDTCPVFTECLTHALTVREEYGVWAGTSGRTRRRLFALIDRGEYTVEQLVEVTLDERPESARICPWPGTPGGYRTEQAGAGLGDEAGGLLAL